MKAPLFPSLVLAVLAWLLAPLSSFGAVAISAIANQAISEDAVAGPISFSITGFTSREPVVTATSDNAALVDSRGIVIAGQGGARTITVTPLANASGTALITVSVLDGRESDTEDFTLTVRAVNDAPTISAIADQVINEDNGTGALPFTVGDVDTAVANLVVTATSSDTSLVPNANVVLGGAGANRTVTVTPVANLSGSTTITVTVSDGALSATEQFTVRVNAVNDPPTISDIPNQNINEDTSTGALVFSVADIDSGFTAPLTVQASSSDTTLIPNANLVIVNTGNARTITVTPSANRFGSATITVTVSDGALTASDSFVVNVASVNDLPTISAISDQALSEDGTTGPLSFTVGDLETAVASLTLQAASSDTTVVPVANVVFGGAGANRTVTVTPAPNQSGAATITVTVSDGSGSASEPFSLRIAAVNDAPTVSPVADVSINENSSTGAIPFTIGDIESGPANLIVQATSSNTGLVPNANIVLGGAGANRTVTVTPVVNQSGSTTITLSVGDGALATTEPFVLTVNAVNDPPTISSIRDQSINEDGNTGALAFTVADNETAAASLTLQAASSNVGLVPVANVVFGGSGANRTVTVTPVANQSGTATITVTVSDGTATASDAFVLTVNPVNDPPTISNIPDQSLQTGSSTGALGFTVGDAETPLASLTLSAASSQLSLVPVSAIVFGGSGANRTVTVTPVGNTPGTVVVTVTVSDGTATVSDAFQITISQTVVAPKIVAAPQGMTIQEGETALFSVTVDGTGPFAYQWLRDGNDIAGATEPTYVIRNATAAQAGAYSVRVSNSAGSVTSAAGTLTVQRFDFGDAPESSITVLYNTRAASKGPRHLIAPEFFLGARVDAEPDGQPNADATGDDLVPSNTDDEDGVVFASSISPGRPLTLVVTSSSKGVLDAWFDFNRAAGFQTGEHAIDHFQLVPGLNTIVVDVPAAAVPGTSFARFRLSRNGLDTPDDAGSTAPPPEGEVEDYQISITGAVEPLDFGDAPESSIAVLYHTRAASKGPRHRIVPEFFLGARVDAEADGQPNADATGDDLAPSNADDEDGVVFGSSISPGKPLTVIVTSSNKGVLDAWFDFNRAAGFESGEHAINHFQLVPGLNTIVVNVPASAVPGTSFARFRLSRDGLDTPDDVASTAPTPEGEVEDYQITITGAIEEIDFGDAPESPAGIAGGLGYPTTLQRNGARHVIAPGWFLGQRVDAEADGQPDVPATGDDLNPKEPDDEDGVVFSSALTAGKTAQIVVTASQTGRLDAWFDFNANKSWGDPGEQVFQSRVVVTGPNALTFPVPASALPGPTYARFRFSRDGKLGFVGQAREGEVEDYRVTLEAGDACDTDSTGRDFWLTIPGNYPQSPGAPLKLIVCIAGPQGTTGTVAIPGLNFSQNFTIPASKTVGVTLPDAASLGDAVDVVETKGIHVTASAPVSVFGQSRIPFSADGFLGLPIGALGRKYLVAAYPNVFNGVTALNGTQFAIVAPTDGTVVTIRPSRSVLGHPAGQPFTVELDEGQTYQLRDPEDATADLSGTEIESDVPIAVFAGHLCANINSPTKFFCDYLVEHLPPVNAWGKLFHTAPLASRTGGDTFRVLGAVNGTQILVNGVANGTVDRGETRTLSLTAAARIVTDHPVYLAQFANSSDFDGVKNADPFMVMVPPVRAYATNHLVCTGTSDFQSHFLQIIAPAGSVGSLTLDGGVVPAGLFTPIAGAGYSYARLPVASGSHTVAASQPLATVLYGFGPYESYGWPGTLHFGDITPPTIQCPSNFSTNVGGLDPKTGTAICQVAVPDLRPGAVISDNCPGSTQRIVLQNPVPGTLVGPGQHPITLTAIDTAGNEASCTVFMTVVDTSPATLTCPKEMTVLCNKGAGATVAYQVIAKTACGTLLPVDCVPPSGALFYPGTTEVKCTIKGSPNQTCSFKVTVVCPPPQKPKALALPAVSWKPGEVLETSFSLDGPWTEVPGAVAPFSPALLGDQQFFRVRPNHAGEATPAPPARIELEFQN